MSITEVSKDFHEFLLDLVQRKMPELPEEYQRLMVTTAIETMKDFILEYSTKLAGALQYAEHREKIENKIIPILDDLKEEMLDFLKDLPPS